MAGDNIGRAGFLNRATMEQDSDSIESLAQQRWVPAQRGNHYQPVMNRQKGLPPWPLNSPGDGFPNRALMGQGSESIEPLAPQQWVPAREGVHHQPAMNRQMGSPPWRQNNPGDGFPNRALMGQGSESIESLAPQQWVLAREGVHHQPVMNRQMGSPPWRQNNPGDGFPNRALMEQGSEPIESFAPRQWVPAREGVHHQPVMNHQMGSPLWRQNNPGDGFPNRALMGQGSESIESLAPQQWVPAREGVHHQPFMNRQMGSPPWRQNNPGDGFPNRALMEQGFEPIESLAPRQWVPTREGVHHQPVMNRQMGSPPWRQNNPGDGFPNRALMGQGSESIESLAPQQWIPAREGVHHQPFMNRQMGSPPWRQNNPGDGFPNRALMGQGSESIESLAPQQWVPAREGVHHQPFMNRQMGSPPWRQNNPGDGFPNRALMEQGSEPIESLAPRQWVPAREGAHHQPVMNRQIGSPPWQQNNPGAEYLDNPHFVPWGGTRRLHSYDRSQPLNNVPYMEHTYRAMTTPSSVVSPGQPSPPSIGPPHYHNDGFQPPNNIPYMERTYRTGVTTPSSILSPGQPSPASTAPHRYNNDGFQSPNNVPYMERTHSAVTTPSSVVSPGQPSSASTEPGHGSNDGAGQDYSSVKTTSEDTTEPPDDEPGALESNTQIPSPEEQKSSSPTTETSQSRNNDGLREQTLQPTMGRRNKRKRSKSVIRHIISSSLATRTQSFSLQLTPTGELTSTASDQSHRQTQDTTNKSHSSQEYYVIPRYVYSGTQSEPQTVAEEQKSSHNPYSFTLFANTPCIPDPSSSSCQTSTYSSFYLVNKSLSVPQNPLPDPLPDEFQYKLWPSSPSSWNTAENQRTEYDAGPVRSLISMFARTGAETIDAGATASTGSSSSHTLGSDVQSETKAAVTCFVNTVPFTTPSSDLVLHLNSTATSSVTFYGTTPVATPATSLNSNTDIPVVSALGGVPVSYKLERRVRFSTETTLSNKVVVGGKLKSSKNK